MPTPPPSNDGQWYLAIDLGTGGVKVAAVLPDGEVVADQFSAIETRHGADGGALQDPADWWLAIHDCMLAVTGSGRVDPQRCCGVGITGQWGSTVPVDSSGNPVGPCLLWSDDRGAALSASLVGGGVNVQGLNVRKAAAWVRMTGGMPSPGGADPTGHAQFLRVHEPEMYGATATLLEPVDYIGLLLTGRVAATPASMVLSWLTDNRPGAPMAYVPSLVRLARREASKLPTLLPTGSTLGPLKPETARLFGFPLDLPVVCGIPDLHTAWLGSGAVDDYNGHIAISTTAWVSASVPFKRTDALRSIASIPSVLPGSYLIANNHDTGGACLRWFREQILGGAFDERGEHGAAPSYDEITAMAASSAVGAGGVIFTPWLKGERSPVDDRNLRAAFLNVSLRTNRADLARAVLEGVAYNARWLLDASEKFAKRKLSPLRILGGGAQSELWCQIHADVIGRPVERVESPLHTNVRGAAQFAALALGHCTLNDIAANSRIQQRYEPDLRAHTIYEPLYREFIKLAASQKKMYRRLNGNGVN